ncbi:MAG: hypothetical protein MJH09_13505 [Cetobacterium sp.]|nr:hypothetical protein [Cetobacterium sp.]
MENIVLNELNQEELASIDGEGWLSVVGGGLVIAGSIVSGGGAVVVGVGIVGGLATIISGA